MSEALWFKGLKAFCGAVAAFFFGLHVMIQLFVWAVLFDILTGLVAAWGEKNISSEFSRKGMSKKTMMVLAVMCAEVVSRSVDLTISSPWGVGSEVSFGAAVAGYYAITEAISITENLSRAGLPLPEFLKSRLDKLREVQR